MHRPFRGEAPKLYPLITATFTISMFTTSGGGGAFGKGEFCGEPFAVNKGGNIFPRRNLGVTLPSSPKLQALCFLRRARRDSERA